MVVVMVLGRCVRACVVGGAGRSPRPAGRTRDGLSADELY